MGASRSIAVRPRRGRGSRRPRRPRHGVAALLLAMTASTLLVVTGGVASADPIDDCYPVPEEGCPLGDELEARVLGPYCEQDVPHLRWELLFADADAEVTVTFVNPDGDDLVYPGRALSGTLRWPGADADAGGSGTNWPGWVFRDGQWVEEDDGFAFTRDDVLIRFAAGEVTYEARVPYPPPTAACADPTPVRGVVIEQPETPTTGTPAPPTTGTPATPTPGTPSAAPPSGTPAVQVAGVTLARTGVEALLLALGGIAALALGSVLVLRGRRRRGDAAPTV
jgi:hypothetical protein